MIDMRSSIRAVVWVPIACVLLASILGWGAWATVGISTSTPRSLFDEHCRETDTKFESMQRELGDKLDRMQELMLQLYMKERDDASSSEGGEP